MCEIQFDLTCDRWNFWKLERDEQKNVAFLKNDKISCYLTDTKYMTFKKKISALDFILASSIKKQKSLNGKSLGIKNCKRKKIMRNQYA